MLIMQTISKFIQIYSVPTMQGVLVTQTRTCDFEPWKVIFNARHGLWLSTIKKSVIIARRDRYIMHTRIYI